MGISDDQQKLFENVSIEMTNKYISMCFYVYFMSWNNRL